MHDYKNPAIRQLKDQQVRFAPVEKRQEQLGRVERLLAELEPARKFPYQYVCFRITDFRPQSYPNLVIEGQDLEHDLRLFIRDLAKTVPPVPADRIPEPVFTLDELSQNLNVSTKTLNRWRDRGLVTRMVIANGRKKLGVRQSLLDRFLKQNRGTVEKGSKFSQLTEVERDELLAHARQLVASGRSFMEVCRQVSERMNRSVETVRYTLKKHDLAHPDQAIFSKLRDSLSEHDKQTIYNAHRRGMSIDSLARRYRRTRPAIHRILNEVRAHRLFAQPLDYIDSPEFAVRELEEKILAPMPNLEQYEAAKIKARNNMPSGLPPELTALYEVPLLSREQEAHLFRQMNFLKAKASRLRAKIQPARARTADLDQLENLIDQAQKLKEQLISANMRLVVSIAKRHVGSADNFFELLSDGNLSLIKAVEKFDYSRGFKFSTYASWAIMKNFARSIPDEKNRRDRYLTGSEEMFEFATDTRSDEQAALASADQAKKQVNRLLDHLSERERRIMQLRAGLDAERGLTLEQVGKELGITKERVRQLEARSMSKLRQLAKDAAIEAN